MTFDSIIAKWNYLQGQPAFRRAPLAVLRRLVEWRVRCLIGRPAAISLPEYGVRLLLPADWRGFAKLLYAFRESYEPELRYVVRVLREGQVVVDVGANVGIYSVVAARYVGPGGRVLSFEPAESVFNVLQQNVVLNGFGNVRSFRMALADREGEVHLYHHPDPSRNALMPYESATRGSERVPVTRLDTVLRQTGLTRIDVVKLDVEGAEELVLRGARETLSRCRPQVIFEVQPSLALRFGLEPFGAWNFLEQYGYEFFEYDETRHLRRLTCRPPGGCNVTARFAGDRQ